MAKNKTVKFFLLVALALFSGRGLAAESDSIDVAYTATSAGAYFQEICGMALDVA